MKPIDQTIVSSLDGAVHGNCFPSCIASLLEVPLESVPEFQKMDGAWHDPFWEFLNQHGCEFQGTFSFERDGRIRTWDELLALSPGIDGFFICNGTSHRAHVTRGHAVIYKDGVLAHDPHSSRMGLLELKHAMMIERRP